MYRLLQVKPIKTTPYHPQTDGLVERFNSTLKSMLKKAASKEGKDWDRLLPYLLFSYREVPQASTGFSPFKLLYGHRVRGPLDILKESWEASTKISESVVSYVLTSGWRSSEMSSMRTSKTPRPHRRRGMTVTPETESFKQEIKCWYSYPRAQTNCWLSGADPIPWYDSLALSTTRCK